MARQRRFALSTGQKIVVWLVGLFIAWQFLRLPNAIEAILTFCLAGVVPGTNIVLSPDAVIHISLGLVGFVLFMAFVVPLIRELFFTKYDHNQEVLEPVAEITQDQPSDEPVAVELTPAQAFRAQLYAVEVAQLPSDTQERAAASGSLLTTVFEKFRAVLQHIMPQVFTALVKAYVATEPHARTAWRKAREYYARLKVYAARFVQWLLVQARAFWRWLVPYLWKFDAWLELRVRAWQARMQHKVDNHDTASTVVDLGKHAKKTIAELDMTAKAKQVKNKAKPYVKKAHGVAKKATTKAAHKARKRIQK